MCPLFNPVSCPIVVTSSSGTVVHSARKEKPAPPPKSVPVSRKATGCQVGHLSVYEVVNQNPQLKVFSQIMQFSNMISLFTDKSLKATIFAPVDYAFGNLLEPGKGFFDLVPDRLIAQTLIAYHIAGAPVLSRYFTDGLEAGTNLSSKVCSSTVLNCFHSTAVVLTNFLCSVRVSN